MTPPDAGAAPGPGHDPSAAGSALFELRAIDKRFAGTHALRSVDLSLLAGEIHAIVGENGAGKSTLIKLLTGVHSATSGELLWEGHPVHFSNPAQALALGINAVHQEVVLCRHLTVAANLFLGREPTGMGLVKGREMVRRAQDILDELGFPVHADAVVGHLTIGQQQLVATAQAATRGTRLLIFDEPTAYLTRQETDLLFNRIREFNRRGITIVYISHRLEEVFELGNRVTVLRDGQKVSTRAVADTDHRQIVRDMVARNIDQLHYKEPIDSGATILATEKLGGPGFSDISLQVRKGEIVGLYGLIGAGRSEFVQSLFGRFPAREGRILWRGAPVQIRQESDAIRLGIALVPESRRYQGLCMNQEVGFNLLLPVFDRLSRLGWIVGARQRSTGTRLVGELRISTPGLATVVGHLSGGNQQKVVVGKWLNHGADLFIFDEPTVGVDVGTKVEIYKLFAALLRRGAGIILISSYLPEVRDLADRLHVFRRGRLVSTHEAGTADEETILMEAISG